MSRIGAALGWLGGPLRLLRRFPWRPPSVDGGLVAPSGIAPADLADEALAGLFARPGRMSLTVLETVIGLAALVATLGLSRTAGNRIVGHFDALAATEIVVSRSATATAENSALPWDAPARLLRLNGVVAAGTMSTVPIGNRQVSTSPISDPTRQTEFKLTVQAVSPGLFPAVRADLRSGRLIDEGHSLRADRVAVLGPSAAQKLGITGLEQMPAIRIGDNIYLVVGILDGVARQPGLLGAVILPEGTALKDFRLTSPEHVVIETRIGAAKVITQQVAQALRPDSPSRLEGGIAARASARGGSRTKRLEPTVPHARRRVASRRRDRYCQCHARLRYGAYRRDRSPACPRRHQKAHCDAVPDGERNNGPCRRRPRRMPRHARGRWRLCVPGLDAGPQPASALCGPHPGRARRIDIRHLSSTSRGPSGARRNNTL